MEEKDIAGGINPTDGHKLTGGLASVLNDFWSQKCLSLVKQQGLSRVGQVGMFILSDMKTLRVTNKDTGETIVEAELPVTLEKKDGMGFREGVEDELRGYHANAGDYLNNSVFINVWSVAN